MLCLQVLALNRSRFCGLMLQVAVLAANNNQLGGTLPHSWSNLSQVRSLPNIAFAETALKAHHGTLVDGDARLLVLRRLMTGVTGNPNRTGWKPIFWHTAKQLEQYFSGQSALWKACLFELK